MQVLCSICNWPGTFFYNNGSRIMKVTSPLERITDKYGIDTIYAHKACLKH